jgi:hypothetical protein
MIRHIPCKYSQEHLIEEISEFTTGFDFLYLPPARTSKTQKNLGYAFLNFREAAEAQKFICDFQNHHFKRHPNSMKRAEVSFAELQGFHQNMEFYKNSKVSKSRFRPYIARD